jgi:hypothetical protein
MWHEPLSETPFRRVQGRPQSVDVGFDADAEPFSANMQRQSWMRGRPSVLHSCSSRRVSASSTGTPVIWTRATHRGPGVGYAGTVPTLGHLFGEVTRDPPAWAVAGAP